MSTPSTTLKIAVVAPIPTASVKPATAVKNGLRTNPFTAVRTSLHIASIVHPFVLAFRLVECVGRQLVGTPP